MPTPEWVQAWFRRLIEASGAEGRGVPWRLLTFKESSLEAYSALDGGLAFSRGTWQKFQETPEQAAAVIAHEMTHVIRQHAWTLSCRVQPLLASLRAKGVDERALRHAEHVFRTTAHAHELEADRGAAVLLARTGAPADAVPRMLRSLGELPESSTHPSTRRRQAAFVLQGKSTH